MARDHRIESVPELPCKSVLILMRRKRKIATLFEGPLIVYGMEGAKQVKAFQNIPGVEVANVDRLNLLKLARNSSTRSLLPCLSQSLAKKSGFGSTNSSLDAPNSPRIFTGCLSATEMELPEDHTSWHAWPPLGGHS
ncbi:hypothetical protein AAG906_029238 [Vitis piasezkii]